MARVTVEDCVDKIPNRFDLVLLAAERALRLVLADDVRVEPRLEQRNLVRLLLHLLGILQVLAVQPLAEARCVAHCREHVVQEAERRRRGA